MVRGLGWGQSGAGGGVSSGWTVVLTSIDFESLQVALQPSQSVPDQLTVTFIVAVFDPFSCLPGE